MGLIIGITPANNGGGSPTPQYDLEDLTLHFDGINNTGIGHDSGTNIRSWKDLIGNNDGLLELDAKFNEDCVEFNGNSRVRFRGDITPEFTMSMVLSYKKVGTHPRFTGDPSFPTFCASSSSDWSLRYYLIGHDADFFPATSIEEHVRYHLCVRYKGAGSKAELFVNGIKVAETKNSPPVPSSIVSAFLGGNNLTTGNTRFLTGYICNFMLFGKAKSNESIANNANVDFYRFIKNYNQQRRNQ